MNPQGYSLVALGETCYLVRFQDALGPVRLNQMADLLLEDKPVFVRDIAATTNGIAVHYDPLQSIQATSVEQQPHQQVQRWLTRLLQQVWFGTPRAATDHYVEVVYGGADGADLAAVAQQTGMTEHEVVALHCRAPLVVAMTGFRPGFAYLEGLAAPLQIARRDVPRARVPAGSVAIGGPYSGIYPFAMPGGWHLLGTTDAVLFDVNRQPAALFRTGDRIHFVPHPRGICP